MEKDDSALRKTPPLGTVGVVGIAWDNRQDYPEILRIMVDAANLPRTHDAWQKRAGEAEREAVRTGIRIVRAVIDPATFPRWCALRGHQIDARARTAFANEQAAGQVGLL